MEKLLIFIKHNIGFLWKAIEWGNDFIFSLFYKVDLNNILQEVLKEFSEPPLSYRRLDQSDLQSLNKLIKTQRISDLEYFNPHGFEITTIKRQFKKQSFLMLGVFQKDKMLGYFFLRFFFNKKCFVGRLIDKGHRGQGIGLVMNNIMYETAWQMRFRCLSTISKNNAAVIGAHKKNPSMLVLKELQNNYLLVEFKRKM